MDLYDRFLRMNTWSRIILCALFGALLQHFWSTVRDCYRVPKSVCLIQDETHAVCQTWALYNLDKLKSGKYGDVAGHSDNCLRSGGRTEFGAQMNDGGIVYTCARE
jgi:hypothetical protein